MQFWTHFTETIPWFIQPGQRVSIVSQRPPSTWQPTEQPFLGTFPRLARLLSAAHVTDLLIDERPLSLFTWPTSESAPAWLCPAPSPDPPKALSLAHQVLLRSFGGIIERVDIPDSWLLNHNQALTLSEASHDASFLNDYSWAFPNDAVPLEVRNYYSIAREANGNTTLCHRETSQILLFAHDHSRRDIRPWAGLPDYTLYELDCALDFTSYVEHIADQWLAAVAS